ncbi:hypothetical protein TNCV_4710531 [Trichonephila clavipes]|uniref:Uncharacterized protein n=1 Tax=Trichonephila clavipes TaxID=2585209 RepID=A0A8X6RTF2_TRICX|nr:hypothetical protein TNCV_4710531 [Trichonephila clavipes]
MATSDLAGWSKLLTRPVDRKIWKIPWTPFRPSMPFQDAEICQRITDVKLGYRYISYSLSDIDRFDFWDIVLET